jgi:uncharacterized protein (TIGR00730 family)
MKKLAVYCGARDDVKPLYKETAKNLGALMAKNNYELVYGGGGTGLMGVLSDEFLEHGGIAHGYTTDLLYGIEKHNKRLENLDVADSMYKRKEKMSMVADGFVILPGGFGTMDEFFDIFVARQLGLHNKPIFIINVDNYWAPLQDLCQKMKDEKFCTTEHLSFLQVFNTPFDFIAHLTLKKDKDLYSFS